MANARQSQPSQSSKLAMVSTDTNALKRLFMRTAAECTNGAFRVDENNRRLVASLFNYFLELPGELDPGKGLWLEGPIGTGKSTLMRVFSAFKRRLGDGFKVYVCSQVTTEYALTGDLDRYLLNESGWLKEPVMMCFDELGREPVPVKHFGTDLNVFQHVLHIRYSLWQESGLKTLVTTNLTSSKVEELYGDYIRDRRKEMFNIVAVTGDSRR